MRANPGVRLLTQLIATMLLVFVIFAGTRMLVRALPGDPAETLIAESGTSLPIEVIRADLGLDRPLLSSIFHDAGRALGGDFGISIFNRKPVGPQLAARFGKTAHLAAVALLLGLAISLTTGLLAAGHRSPGADGYWGRIGAIADRICTIHGALAAALPTPWTGPILIILFALWIPVFSIGGSVALPALTLAISFSGFWSRLIRQRVGEMLQADPARAARARGVPEWKVLTKYGLVPASGALAAYLGTQLGFMLAGAFVTEVIFDWRGLGSFLIEAVLRRDYPVVEGAAFVAASATLIGNLLGDLAQFALSPKRWEDA